MNASPFLLEQLEPKGELVGAGASPADRAAEIIAQAQVRAAEIEAQARESGIEIGRAEGRELAAVETERLRGLLQATIEAVEAGRDEFLAAAELHAVELALALSEKIVCAALDLEPERVLDVVAGTLRRIADRDRLVIELNPDDVELVREWLDGDGATWGRIELHAERRVARGGCVARTADGEIDARPAEQLAHADELLRRAWVDRA